MLISLSWSLNSASSTAPESIDRELKGFSVIINLGLIARCYKCTFIEWIMIKKFFHVSLVSLNSAGFHLCGAEQCNKQTSSSRACSVCAVGEREKKQTQLEVWARTKAKTSEFSSTHKTFIFSSEFEFLLVFPRIHLPHQFALIAWKVFVPSALSLSLTARNFHFHHFPSYSCSVRGEKRSVRAQGARNYIESLSIVEMKT